MTEPEKLRDQIALVEALADYARFKVESDATGATIVRLARRLVEDPRLTDADAVRIAGRHALAAVRERAS